MKLTVRLPCTEQFDSTSDFQILLSIEVTEILRHFPTLPGIR